MNVYQETRCTRPTPVGLGSSWPVVESEIEKIDRRIVRSDKPQQFPVSVQELREFVTLKALNPTSVLRSDVPTARNVLANHIDKLTRTPKDAPDEFRSVRCPGCRSLGGNDRVGPMVAGVGYRVFAPNGADDREFKSWSEMVHANISK